MPFHWKMSYFCTVIFIRMRNLGLIVLLFLLLPMSGCTSHAGSSDCVEEKTSTSVLLDKVESNLMNLYSAASDNRNALQEEANAWVPVGSVRIVNQRNRNVIQHHVTLRQALMRTHRPAVSRLIHHSITQLLAFSKEYHIFRLRRILI